MNSMQTAVSSAVKNSIISKSPRRENRKKAVPVVQAPAAAPVVAAPVTPKPTVVKEKVQKPEPTFTILSREALAASDFGKRLEAAKSDAKIHLNHNHQVLEAILSLKGKSFTLAEVISALDVPRYCDKHEKSPKLLRAYVLDNLEILAEKIPAGLSVAK